MPTSIRLFVLLLSCLLSTQAVLQTNSTAARLQISKDNHFIQYADGRPFFYLGDTAWELFHRLDRREAKEYMENRAAKGFTVIQAVVLAERDGLNVANALGDKPLINNDPTQPNEAYFKHVDYIVNLADSLGMFIGMLPTWGDKFNNRWGIGPEIFTPENARHYGEFLGKRYRDKPIIWILGGDRIPEKDVHYAIIRAMAAGLAAGDGGNHLMTYHPMGARNSSEFFHTDDWLDFNMFQSGHGEVNNQNFRKTEQDYKLTPTKPVLDAEPCYEDHPINWQPANGWFDEFDSRRAGYWAMLAGAAGHTYGNHNVWQMFDSKWDPITHARTPWWQALDYPGAVQAGYMRWLFESRPWQQLVPDQSVIASGPNQGGKDVRAAIAQDGSFLFVYAPYGTSFTLNLTKIKASQLRLWWFNPRLGNSIFIGEQAKSDKMTFDPPADEARGNDWVLVVDNAEAGYGRPGKP